jgi:urocanate hydratase
MALSCGGVGIGDPAMGVIRHTDADYEEAVAVAQERGVRVPMREETPGDQQSSRPVAP